MSGEKEELTNLEKYERAQYFQSVIDTLGTEEEREAVRLTMKSEGIELTGEEEGELLKQLEADKSDETDNAGETDETKKTEETDPPDDPKTGESEEKEETDPNITALQAQIDAQARELAELRQKQISEEHDKDLRAQASKKVEAALASLNEEKEKQATQLAEFRELYGEEAADELQKQQELLLSVKTENLKSQQETEYAKLKAEHAETLTAKQTWEQEIQTIPELNQWRVDHDAAEAGDKSKSSANWNYAIATDDMLRQHPDWADKPRTERYKEVTKRVKADMGIQSGSQESKEEGTREKLAKLIQQQNDKDASYPGSLSDISGGVGGKRGITEDHLEKMDTADLASLNLSSDKLLGIAASL